MSVRPCPFCPRAGKPAGTSPAERAQPCAAHTAGVKRLAIPAYRTRVSPVLDTCTRLMVIDLNGKSEICRREIALGGASLMGRLGLLLDLNVEIVICAGTSLEFYQELKRKGMDVISGIAGDIDQVLKGFRENRLRDPVFNMPGFTSLHALTEISQQGSLEQDGL